MSEGKLFTQKLREITKDIHTLSDHLVNLKLGIALSNDQVWAEGLAVFYPVFKYLEEALERHEQTLLGDFRIEKLTQRTEAFEKDLKFYLGNNWSEKISRPSVNKYLQHLRFIENENPYILIAYIYHLYMGLLSGGQILQGKRNLNLLKKSNENDESNGRALTYFGVQSISSLKRRLRETTNKVSEELDENTLEIIIHEGVRVFELNNEIIRSVKGVNEIFLRKILWIILICIILGLVFFMLSNYSI